MKNLELQTQPLSLREMLYVIFFTYLKKLNVMLTLLVLSKVKKKKRLTF